MQSIQLPRTIVNKILAHAQQSAEYEICGFISQKDENIFRSYPIENTAYEPAKFFRMDAKAQIDAMRAMRENNEKLFAIYHSHPSTDAYPSAIDIRDAQYPEVNFIIVSLKTKGVLDLRAYRIRQQQVELLEVYL